MRTAQLNRLCTSRMTSQQPIYGNFQRYYHIRNPTSHGGADVDAAHPAVQLDSRLVPILAFLDERSQTCGQSVRKVLDIGCNSGKLTIQLAQMLREDVSITGVDIDSILIRQAKDAAATTRSLCRPESVAVYNLSCEQKQSTIPQLPPEAVHFPSVFPALFGPRPEEEDTRPTKVARRCTSVELPEKTMNKKLAFPQLEFLAAEWSTYGSPVNGEVCERDIVRLQEKDALGYDLVLALSLTKWVHIHTGDVGLARFFARVCQSMRVGSVLIVEPQDWKSYDAPKRMSNSIRDQVQALKMRPHGDFHWLLESVGLTWVRDIGIGVGTGFTRPLQVYCKASPNDSFSASLIETLLNDEKASFPWVTRPHKPSSDAAMQ